MNQRDEKVAASERELGRSFPPEVESVRQWCLWRLENDQKGRPTKVPYQVDGRKAATDNRYTWATFADACSALARSPDRFQGVGYIFSAEDETCGVDLDVAIDKHGVLHCWAEPIVERFRGTYMATSISGRGLHILCRGALPAGKGRNWYVPDGPQDGSGKRAQVGLFDRGRFFALTGNVYVDSPLVLTDRQDDLDWLVAEMTAPRVAAPQAITSSASDAEIIGKARAAKNGAKFSDLWDGHWQAGYPSQSEADLGLCSMLAYWCGSDPARIDALFRQSGLFRPKWSEREDYRLATIARALGKVPATAPRLVQQDDAARLPGDNESGAGDFHDGLAPGVVELVGLTSSVAMQILSRDRFAQDAGGALYHYAGGHYQPRGEEIVRRRIQNLLAGSRMERKWRTGLNSEVIEYIRIPSPHLITRPPLDVINVLNGLLDVPTRQLKPHSPDYLCPVQLPLKYNAAAECPGWDTFIRATFPKDAFNVACEIPALLMTPGTDIQKAILLMGAGGNGKSIYLNALVAFLGRANCSFVPLHKLETDRFAAARLIGKLANICADLPAEDLKGTATFKAITGGDPIMAEYKYRDSFDFVPFARLVFSANQPPPTCDSSDGYFRRWIVVPFDQTFSPDAPGYLPKDQLEAILHSAGELSGLLNRALDSWPRLQQRAEITESGSMKRARDEFRQATDPFAVWLEMCTYPDINAMEPKAVLYASYQHYAQRYNRALITMNRFGRELKRYRPNLTEGQRRITGVQTECWLGLALRSPAGT